MTAAVTKTGEHVGKKAVHKIVKMLSKNSESKKVETVKPKKMTQQEINNSATNYDWGEKNYIIIKIK